MTRQGRALTRAITTVAAALFASVAIAGPAVAAPTEKPSTDDEVCWLNADNGDFRCFDSEAEFESALVTAASRRVATEGLFSASLNASTVASGSVIARFYADINYGGAHMVVSSWNSATCATGSFSANLPSNWNDRISSFRSYNGCSTLFYEHTGYGGATYGYYTQRSSMGSFNDRASSYRLT